MTKYLTPKKYDALPDDQKIGWLPQYKEYATTTTQEMEYCDCCGHEIGMEDVVTRTPIGEPYRYAWSWASDLQLYYANKLLEQSMCPNILLGKLKR
jgi:hypothetical protein